MELLIKRPHHFLGALLSGRDFFEEEFVKARVEIKEELLPLVTAVVEDPSLVFLSDDGFEIKMRVLDKTSNYITMLHSFEVSLIDSIIEATRDKELNHLQMIRINNFAWGVDRGSDSPFLPRRNFVDFFSLYLMMYERESPSLYKMLRRESSASFYSALHTPNQDFYSVEGYRVLISHILGKEEPDSLRNRQLRGRVHFLIFSQVAAKLLAGLYPTQRWFNAWSDTYEALHSREYVSAMRLGETLLGKEALETLRGYDSLKAVPLLDLEMESNWTNFLIMASGLRDFQWSNLAFQGSKSFLHNEILRGGFLTDGLEREQLVDYNSLFLNLETMEEIEGDFVRSLSLLDGASVLREMEKELLLGV